MSKDKIVRYGAVGEEGCEFMADTKKEVQAWIDAEIAGNGHADTPVPEDYYSIYGYTREELNSMVET